MNDKINALDRLIEAVEAGLISKGVTGLKAFEQFSRDAFGLYQSNAAWRAYGGSLDAALALHEALLPNRYWKLEEWDGAWTAEIPFSALIKHEATDEHSAARAWLLAVLKAYRSVQQ